MADAEPGAGAAGERRELPYQCPSGLWSLELDGGQSGDPTDGLHMQEMKSVCPASRPPRCVRPFSFTVTANARGAGEVCWRVIRMRCRWVIHRQDVDDYMYNVPLPVHVYY